MSHDVQRLVVLGSTVTALAIVRNCHAIGLPCTLVDTREDIATLSRLANVEVANDDDALLAVLADLAVDGNTALIADSDRWLRWLMRHRGALQDQFQWVLHPPDAVLETCLNKTLFIRWCKEKRFPAPDIYEVAAGHDHSSIEFPVLVRPDETRHGAADGLPKAVEIADSIELAALLNRYDELGATPNICQSLLRPNVRQYSVGVARSAEECTKIFVAEKLRPSAAMCAGGTYVVGSPDENVATLVEDATTALGLFGIAEVEVIKDEDTGELFLLEVNARPWVQYSLATRSGFELLEFLLRPDRYDAALECAEGSKWINFGDDLYVVLSRSGGMLVNEEISFLNYFKSMLTANAFAFWALTDPRPFLANSIRQIRKLLS